MAQVQAACTAFMGGRLSPVFTTSCFTASKAAFSLQVDDEASHAEIKTAYRNLAKQCHPDILGEAGHSLCILLNEVNPRSWSPTILIGKVV